MSTVRKAKLSELSEAEAFQRSAYRRRLADSCSALSRNRASVDRSMTTPGSHYQYSTQLSRHQQYVLATIERVCSCVSVVASGVVIATFVSSTEFRKPINRLIFYASWGNLLSNSATLIADSSLQGHSRGALCQFQGFMIQWFLPADSLWALAMACNVYLAIFKHYDTRRLGMLEWKYVLFCYGVPFIPAFVYLFLSSESRGKVYGDSVLWCWVSLRWDFLQIAVFYGPIWFIVLLILAIYIRVGVTIWRQRRELRKTVRPAFEHAIDTTVLGDVDLHGTAQPVPLGSLQRHSNRERSPASTAASSQRIISREVRSPQDYGGPQNAPPSTGVSRSSNISPATSTTLSRHNYDLGQSGAFTSPASEAYYKYAVLFFAALIITWVPSSANRVYALATSNHYFFGLSCVSSFALPLQGFWNSLIFITVSWKAIVTWFRQVGARARRTSSTTFRPFKYPLRR